MEESPGSCLSSLAAAGQIGIPMWCLGGKPLYTSVTLMPFRMCQVASWSRSRQRELHSAMYRWKEPMRFALSSRWQSPRSHLPLCYRQQVPGYTVWD